MTDIHHSEENFRRQLKSIKENTSFSSKNKKLILQFSDDCISDGLSKIRVAKYISGLKQLIPLMKKDFDKATEKDIRNLMKKIESRDYTEWTKRDYRVLLKKFYNWLKKDYENKKQAIPNVDWIKTNIKNSKKKLPEEMLSEKEVEKLIAVAQHPRDKALISVLYDSGARIGELLSVKIKNVHYDKYGAIINVNGKTGPRRVRLILSSPYLVQWMNLHPLKEKKDAPLWIGIGTVGRDEALEYASVRKLLAKTFKEAKINKNCNPHIFRHSRATSLAQDLTESQLKEFFGWAKGSDQPATYVHLSGKQVDDAILRSAGIKKEEEKEKSILSPKKCKRCGEINSHDNSFCIKCTAPLDMKIAIEMQDKRARIDNFWEKMLDEELIQMIRRKSIEKGLDGEFKSI